MSNKSRPLSPHLQIYRPQLTSVLSVLHRLTGVALALGVPVFVAWLIAAAAGPDAYAAAEAWLGSWAGLLLLLGGSFALFYHLCNGIRHLLWDAGFGFAIATVYASGWAAVAAAAALTVLAWAYVLAVAGSGG